MKIGMIEVYPREIIKTEGIMGDRYNPIIIRNGQKHNFVGGNYEGQLFRIEGISSSMGFESFEKFKVSVNDENNSFGNPFITYCKMYQGVTKREFVELVREALVMMELI